MLLGKAATVTRGEAVGPTLGEAIKLLLENKRQLARRERYVKALGADLGLFARGRETVPISTLSTESVENWVLSRQQDSPTRRISNISRLSTLFAFCHRRGWIGNNICDNIERPSIDRKPASVLSPEQVESALKFTLEHKPEFLAWLTNTMIVGLRPESEADTLERERIDFENHRLIVVISKVRSHRIIDLRDIPPAEPWLRKAVTIGARFQIPYPTRRKYLRALREHLGFETWPQDCLRHTAASYLLAHHKSAEKVALILGNSAGVVHRHYKSLITEDDASRFMFGAVELLFNEHARFMTLTPEDGYAMTSRDEHSPAAETVSKKV